MSDYPDDPEEWPELEEEMIPQSAELPTSGPFAPAFQYLHAARVTVDAGLLRPTLLLARTAARLTLRAVEEAGMDPAPEERAEIQAIAAGEVAVDVAEDLLDVLTTLSAFVERRITVPGREDRGE